jgi:hypothetical protein
MELMVANKVINISKKHQGKCRCKKDMLPEVIPQVSIGFRHKGLTTLCYFQIRKTLRVGSTICGNDEFNPVKGEKVALQRAMDQHKIGKLVRSALWALYLSTRGQEVDPAALSTLKWFQSGKVQFDMK